MTEEKPHLNAYALTMGIIISFSSFVYGYSGAVIATTLTQPSFEKELGLDTATNKESLIGAINGLFYAGGVFGSFTSVFLSNKWGRKMTTATGNVILMVANAVMTGSTNAPMFIVFRFVAGFSSFLIVSSVPVWVAELAPSNIRGIMVDTHAVMMMTGYAVATYAGLGFYFVPGDNAWRGQMGLGAAWPFLILCGIYWLPESPRFLVAHDRATEAWEVIKRMHLNPSQDPRNEFAKREFHQIQKQVDLDSALPSSYMQILMKPSFRRRVLITVALELFVMSSGVLVILNNGSIIWADIGFSTSQVLNLQAGFQLCGLVFNIVAMAFVDRVKRNWIIPIGLVTCAAAILIQMILQMKYVGTTNKAGLGGATAMIYLFQALYSLFLDGPSYFYVAEIWPSHLRTRGFAIGMASLCGFNMMWLLAAPTAMAKIGWTFYLFFIIIPGIGAVITYFTFPDTLKKPLEEIATMFGDEDIVAVHQQDVTLAEVQATGYELADGKQDKGTVVHLE